MMKIQVFEAEKNLGLERNIHTNASIKYLAPLVPSKNVYTAKASTDNSDPLLYKMTDVLASTGWNLNEDVFDPYELYSARNTPVNKPFDIEHVESDIIGHIIGSRCITGDMEDGDSDYEELGDDLPIDEIPSRFHVLNDSVIYKTWSDEDKMAATEAMIEEIENGDWFVSMECKFLGFDYAVINPEGEQACIARSEDTAFLTKYLRSYGGTGEYVDKATGSVYKIGRLIKNIIFSGKGLVKKPANPESVIVNKQENVQASIDKVYDNSVTVSSNTNKENTMSDELKDINQKLSDQVAKLTTELESIKASQTTEKLTALASEVEQLKAQKQILEGNAETFSKANDELSSKLEKAEKELADLKAEKKKSDRAKKMKDAGADDEDVEASINSLVTLTDEQFDGILTTLAKSYKAKKAAPSEPNTVQSSEAGQKLIENAKANTEETPNLAVTEESKLESTRASIAEKFAARLKNKSK